MEEKSIAWEMLKSLKKVITIISVISVIELLIIAYMGYLIYDSQFDYSYDTIQDVTNTSLNNSNITQN